MMKVILSNGYEFKIITNGLAKHNNSLTVKFVPDEYTVEDMVDIWSDNDSITIANEGILYEKFDGYTRCNKIELHPNSVIGIKYGCSACEAEIENLEAESCPECGVEFDGETNYIKTITEIGNAISVTVSMASDESRLADLEDAVQDIIASLIYNFDSGEDSIEE